MGNSDQTADRKPQFLLRNPPGIDQQISRKLADQCNYPPWNFKQRVFPSENQNGWKMKFPFWVLWPIFLVEALAVGFRADIFAMTGLESNDDYSDDWLRMSLASSQTPSWLLSDYVSQGFKIHVSMFKPKFSFQSTHTFAAQKWNVFLGILQFVFMIFMPVYSTFPVFWGEISWYTL